MDKIILFDIDGTLFDPKLFLENLYKRVSEKFKLLNFDENSLKYLYLESKVDGYFKPDLFLPKLLEHLEPKDRDSLDGLFWDQEALDSCLFEDSTVVEAVSKIATPTIFSTGDAKYQKTKVAPFFNVIGQENIFIYPDKLDHFQEVLDKFPNRKIFLVDDRAEVIEKAKEINPNFFAVLINRGKIGPKNAKIEATIGNLYEILPIIS